MTLEDLSDSSQMYEAYLQLKGWETNISALMTSGAALCTQIQAFKSFAGNATAAETTYIAAIATLCSTTIAALPTAPGIATGASVTTPLTT